MQSVDRSGVSKGSYADEFLIHSSLPLLRSSFILNENADVDAGPGRSSVQVEQNTSFQRSTFQ